MLPWMQLVCCECVGLLSHRKLAAPYDFMPWPVDMIVSVLAGAEGD